MSTNDQNKLMVAGFTIIRAQDTPYPHIKYRIGQSGWKVWLKFASKTARNKAMKDLLERDFYIAD